MSIPFHALLSGTLGYLIGGWPLMAFWILLGIGPDAISWAWWFFIENQNPEVRWDLYKQIHLREPHWWEWLFLTPWALHIWMDKFVHKPEGGWTENAILIEIIGWLVIVLVLYGIGQ